ncbi:MAG: putative baseplate assembly protein [Cyanobacteria bacterium SBLK]|nr:putative baseplate assembly protein [Cyanobacteria bacterium SBLK]
MKKLLKTLPKPDLDDRKFEDLVAECILRIPRYCPEWTNHNPGDPGITLIELFAWLTDQVLLRFNQVPLRNYITFLELLGISLDPPKAAAVELTFYLSKEQSRRIVVEERTEVATVRTETNPAIIFTTDRELTIAPPALKYLLVADDSTVPPDIVPPDNPLAVLYLGETRPNAEQLDNWTREVGEVALFPNFISGNCFYLVLGEELAEGERERKDPLKGHVLAITFKGQAATGTGIDPKNPPLRWEAWDGNLWQRDILRQPQDDRTQGFSFHDAEDAGINPVTEGADTILHLPQQWPETSLGTPYTGHWLRCIYETDEENYASNQYRQSPQIRGMKVRAIGAAVTASECVRVENELLGVSDGKPGQRFPLQGNPILECDRDKGEYIQVRLLDGERENWEEVPDFGDSNYRSPHYLLNLQAGEVQFGPLIREPGRIKRQTQERIYRQPGGRLALRGRGALDATSPALPPGEYENTALEWQYGRIPPRGSEIYMRTYRTGGGKRGNVQPQKLTTIKSAIPYIKSVTNYEAARGGEDAQSLEQAIIGIPKLLRTRESAVMPEDFERIARDCGGVARAHCVRDRHEGGTVFLLIVPHPDPLLPTDRLDFSEGISPDRFALREEQKREIVEYMSDRKPLGIQIRLEAPQYVGVKVKAEIVLEGAIVQELANLEPPEGEKRRKQLKAQLCEGLYRFLNPLTGGWEEEGWPQGSPVYESDIITWCQQMSGIRVGKLQLFSIRLYDTWTLEPVDTKIDLDRWSIFCSWCEQNRESDRFGHEIQLIN